MYDCVQCGACCCNSAENVAEGYPWYVEIEDPKSPLLRRKDLRRKFVTEDPDGVPHLRLDKDGRCLALRGALGKQVRCAIYAQRAAGCRRVQPGDANCLQARRDKGLPVD